MAVDPDVRLRAQGNPIAGIVQDEAYFRREVEPHLDNAAISYVGPVDVAGKNALFARAAAVLHLNTIPERFGLVLAEANAAGVPEIDAFADVAAVPEPAAFTAIASAIVLFAWQTRRRR